MADRLTEEQIEKIVEELEAENKIGAIKICREFTGWGLKESKEFVDNYVNDLIERDPEKYSHLLSAGSRGCFGVMAVVGFSLGIIIILV